MRSATFAKICSIALISGCTVSSEFSAPGLARNQTVAIASSTRFDAQKFAGRWFVRQSLAAQFAPRELNVKTQGTTLVLEEIYAPCPGGSGSCASQITVKTALETGPGRLDVRGPNGTRQQLWVLWVDDGFRTAALAAPDGTLAWILDRNTQGGQDRISAARTVVAFNGFDLRQLEDIQ